MKKILITGASGFIGQSLIKSLLHLNRSVRGTIRSRNPFFSDTKTEYLFTGDINLKTNWKESLVNIDCIIHCAGKAHIIKSKRNDLSKIYQSVNVDATKRLAEEAVKAKVRRLIFLSTIKVNGENTDNDDIGKFLNEQKKNVFSHKDLASPEDHYALSKLDAEKVLWEISSRTGLQIVVVRLPLVYGYGVKGNLARLIKLIRSGIPLPLKMVKNQRSMIGIDNLTDLLIRCIDHPEASGKTFLASDGKDLSTPELIKLIASSMGRKANLIPVPLFLLKFLGSIFNKTKEINRLAGSLRVDNIHIKETLNWTAPISVEEGIRRMIQKK
jgi:nucleoside-diphosphate-sugar epimerase